MNASTFENLDLACAKVGKTIATQPSKELENLITNALAVLEEQGVYALFIYLKAQGKDIGKDVRKNLSDFLKRTPQHHPLLSESSANIFNALQDLGGNLDNLLLARELLRQSLVYARYHARIPQKKEV